MASKNIKTRIKHKRDTSSNWTKNDPVLLNGEVVIVDTANGEMRTKTGNGTSKYSALPFDDEAIKNLINNKVDKVSGKGLSTNDYNATEKSHVQTAYEHSQATHAPSNAEANQNAYSNVKVGTTTVSAKSATDTITLEAGDNVTLTPDATNKKVTIKATNTVYTHPTHTAKTNGLYKVTVDSLGHVSGTTALSKGDITALGIPAQDTVYEEATTSTAGLLSKADKAKLDSITESADSVSVSRSLTSGTKVGSITVNGTATDLYCETNTDTHHQAKNITTNSATSTTQSITALTNGNVYLNLVENGTKRSSHKISGSGATTVTTDASGNIIISSTDNNTVYTHPTSGVTAGTYKSVTVNAQGHVTGGTNPTTISGYGITDAKIASGTITLGSNTITPLTSSSSLNAAKLTGTASVDTSGNAATAMVM